MENLLLIGVPILKHIRVCPKEDAGVMVNSLGHNQAAPKGALFVHIYDQIWSRP